MNHLDDAIGDAGPLWRVTALVDVGVHGLSIGRLSGGGEPLFGGTAPAPFEMSGEVVGYG